MRIRWNVIVPAMYDKKFVWLIIRVDFFSAKNVAPMADTICLLAISANYVHPRRFLDIWPFDFYTLSLLRKICMYTKSEDRVSGCYKATLVHFHGRLYDILTSWSWRWTSSYASSQYVVYFVVTTLSQVWKQYDHPSISYGAFCAWALWGLMTFDLKMVSLVAHG